jgi:hypothetical protein
MKHNTGVAIMKELCALALHNAAKEKRVPAAPFSSEPEDRPSVMKARSLWENLKRTIVPDQTKIRLHEAASIERQTEMLENSRRLQTAPKARRRSSLAQLVRNAQFAAICCLPLC